VLDTKCPGMQMFAVSAQCAVFLPPNETGRWELPVGKYTITVFDLIRQRDDGEWTMLGRAPIPALKSFEITPDKPLVVELGTPLELKYSIIYPNAEHVSFNAEHVSFTWHITGKGGERYVYSLHGKDAKLSPPLVIKSESGEKLHEGKYNYG